MFKTPTRAAKSVGRHRSLTLLGVLAAGFAAWAGVVVAASPAPPAPSISAQPANPTNQTSASFTFTDSQAVTKFQCALDSATFADCGTARPTTKSYSGLGAGGHTFQVRAVSTAGTSSPTSYSWTIDVTAPTLSASSIVRTSSSPTNMAVLSWSVTFSEPVLNVGAANFALVPSNMGGTAPSITGVAPTSGPASTYTVTASTAGATGLNNGSIGLNLTSKGSISDQAGNALAGSTPIVGQAYAFDTTAPPVPSLTGGPANPVAATSASFVFADSEAGVTYLCSLDGGQATVCPDPAPYSGLGQGLHGFRVQARDAAGNVSGLSGSWPFFVDTVNPARPVFSQTPPNPGTSATSTFAWSATDPAPGSGVAFYLCSKENGSYQSCSSPYTYAVGTSNNGQHQFAVLAVDWAGNTSSAASYSWKVAAGSGQNYAISGTVSSLLYPGATPQPINLTFSNPNAGNGGSGVNGVQISSLTVQIQSITGPNITTAHPCTATDYAIVQFSGTYPFYIPQGASSLSSLGFGTTKWPTLQLINRPVNQDGCQGATVTLQYAGTP